MQYVVYSFEAKSIQTYVLASSKLKDRIGASEQIESLCTYNAEHGLLDKILSRLKLKDKVDFSRRAGGAFVAIFPRDLENAEQLAKDLQAVWTFTVQKRLPGLRFNHGIGVADSKRQAVDNAFEQQRLSQQYLFPTLPMAGPLAEFSPRSGRVAVDRRKGKESTELLDEATQLKRNKSHGKLLINKIGALGGDADFEWPTIMPEEDEEGDDKDKTFVFPTADKTIAVVHADINNLGNISLALFKQFDDEDTYVEEAQAFTEAIEEAVKQAVRSAVAQTIAKHPLSARPLVLAGDDITFIVRGDIALGFTETLLIELEKTTLDALKPIKNAPEFLTACAGIAYIKASQPFYQAYRLADSLCEMAKHESKRRKHDQQLDNVPSSLAFHRITTSMIERYQSVIDKELTTDDSLVLSHHPYFVGEGYEQKPRLDDLTELQIALNKAGHSRVRPLLSMLYENETKADMGFDRWRDVLMKTGQKETYLSIVDGLLKLTGKDVEGFDPKTVKLSDLSSLFNSGGATRRRTPLADAIALTRVNQKEAE